jgi:hypothetical protein
LTPKVIRLRSLIAKALLAAYEEGKAAGKD